MNAVEHGGIGRRRFLAWTAMSGAALLVGAGCEQKPRIFAAEVHVDAGCGCCHGWADSVKASGRFTVTVIEDPDMAAYKARVGVPSRLGSCHTALIDGYVIEGHVPAADILRLLEERPAGVVGIAVPGMPRGSPGMEQPSGARDTYEVLEFTSKGETRVYSLHPAS